MKARQKVPAGRVREELVEGQSTALLRELHLLTREGHLNADARRKLKQVNHLHALLSAALDDVLQRFAEPMIVDMGAGKSYLGFILYELRLKGRETGTIWSVESRGELVGRGEAMAGRLGFSRMKFVQGEIATASLPERVHLLTALHACDTATDDALIAGIERGADHIAVVPCCQAELARLLAEKKQAGVLGELYAHGIHRREFGSHVTNVLRALTLEAHGYQVSVTELVGWEHSLKNELIVARRIRASNPPAMRRLRGLVEQLGVAPKIVRHFLGGAGEKGGAGESASEGAGEGGGEGGMRGGGEGVAAG